MMCAFRASQVDFGILGRSMRTGGSFSVMFFIMTLSETVSHLVTIEISAVSRYKVWLINIYDWAPFTRLTRQKLAAAREQMLLPRVSAVQ